MNNQYANGRIWNSYLDYEAPIVVSLGMGDNSVGMIMGLYEAGIRPDAILFSNLGNEYAHTISFIPLLARWLKKVGFPQLTIVEYRPARFKRQAYSTLAGNCIANRTLPGLAYGRKSCSMKWKGQPMDRAVTEMFGAQGCFRLIGYDCDPRDMKRFAKATNKDGVNEKRPLDQFIYPLVELRPTPIPQRWGAQHRGYGGGRR